jgi:hypothetical protein
MMVMAMPTRTHTTQVHRTTKKKGKKRQSKKLTAFDNLVLLLSFVSPLSGIPQAVDIWVGNGSVSILTWTLFFLNGVISLIYGIIHKIKPIIVTNVIWSVIDLAIIVGMLVL